MVMQVPWPVMNSLISLDLDHNNFGDNLAEPGRFNGLNVLQVTTTKIMMVIIFMIMLMNVIKGRYDDDDDVDDDMMMISSRCHCVGTG